MYDFSFLKGSIETIILNALYSGDKYGYEIAREIKEKTENKYEIKQPTLYGYLKRLEQNNLILSYRGDGDTNGGRRRYYTLTDAGKKICIDYMSEWNFQRDIIDSLVAKADNENDIREISQADATSILGTKSKRTYRKRELVSNNDLDELNKQLDLLKTSTEKSQQQDSNIQLQPEKPETLVNQSTEINNKPQQQPIQPTQQQPTKPEILRYEVAPDPYRPNATIITPYTVKPSTQNQPTQTEEAIKEENSREEQPEKLSINEQLKNMAPAGPQLIFAPCPPSTTPIITASSFEKTKQQDHKPSTPPQRPINNSPIITSSSFLTNKQNTTEQKQPSQKLYQKEFTEEKQYKQILGNLLEDQLDEMSKTTFDAPEKYDVAINNAAPQNNGNPIPMKSIVKELEKNGIKSNLYNKQLSNSYISKEMIFTNKTKCYLACMLAASLILEYILMFVIFKAVVPDLKFTIFTILTILTCLPAGCFVLNYILHPTKKSEKKFNFKFNFTNSWILVGSVLAILLIIYFVIIGVGEVKQFLLDFILPFIISLNVPLGVVYYNLILKIS